MTDSLPALALAVDPAEKKDVMERKPIKPKKGIFTNGMSWRIIYQGVMIGLLLTLAAFIIGLGTKRCANNRRTNRTRGKSGNWANNGIYCFSIV